jgi:hypothetical protein
MIRKVKPPQGFHSSGAIPVNKKIIVQKFRILPENCRGFDTPVTGGRMVGDKPTAGKVSETLIFMIKGLA